MDPKNQVTIKYLKSPAEMAELKIGAYGESQMAEIILVG